jgi:hypothetical protein
MRFYGAHPTARRPHAGVSALLGAFFGQPGALSFFGAVSGRNHKAT